MKIQQLIGLIVDKLERLKWEVGSRRMEMMIETPNFGLRGIHNYVHIYSLKKKRFPMICFPNAKINLGLHITAKRKDGYHDIETCMVPIPLYDALEVVAGNKTVFEVSGLAIPGDEKENLILKALKLLRKDFNDLPPVHIHLLKNIPMGMLPNWAVTALSL